MVVRCLLGLLASSFIACGDDDERKPDADAATTADVDTAVQGDATFTSDGAAETCDCPDDGDPCTLESCATGSCARAPVTTAAAMTLSAPDEGAFVRGPVTVSVTFDGPIRSGPTGTLDDAAWTPGTPIVGEGPHRVRVDAVACEGTALSASRTFTIDDTPPTLEAVLDPPPNAAGWSRFPTTVTFVASDASALVRVSDPVFVETQGRDQIITGEAEDAAGNVTAVQAKVSLDTVPPPALLQKPAVVVDGDRTIVVGARDIEVAGALSADALSGFAGGRLDISTSAADLVFAAPTGFSETLHLESGQNALVLSARDVAGNVGAVAVVVVVDDEAPHVHIQSPLDGAVVDAPTVDVVGVAQDLVVGMVSSDDLVVEVNGAIAAVQNARFIAPAVALEPGPNTIRALATDTVGHTSEHVITVTRVEPGAVRLRLVSGHDQRAPIGALLPAPLVVEVTDAHGTPLSDREVVFAVTDNDALLDHADAVMRGPTGRTLLAETGPDGRARVDVTLGRRSGEGVNRVTASTAGAPPVHAHFTGLPGEPAAVHVHAGANQSGLAEAVLPMPLVVRITDAGGNPVPGAVATFEVVRGDGKLGAGTVAEAPANADGFAMVPFSPGALVGLAAHEVIAYLPDELGALSRDPGRVASFQASVLAPSLDGVTRIRGLVLDEDEQPLADVPVWFEGWDEPGEGVWTGPDGRFDYVDPPPGYGVMIIDGTRKVTTDGSRFPSVPMEVFPVTGAETPLDRPVHLLRLAPGVFVDGLTTVELTAPELPGMKLTIPAGTRVSFPDGSSEGMISLTQVHFDQAPMAPIDGLQSRVLVTIQPTGVRFDPPAPLELPNVDGYARGRKVEMYSYDHDLETFVQIGTGSVTDDGTRIVSDPGVGVVRGGWHCGTTPSGQGGSGGLGARATVAGGAGDPFVVGSGRPPENACWEIETCGSIAAGDGSSCDNQERCRSDLSGTNPDGSGEGWVRVTHICKTTGERVSDDQHARVCPDEAMPMARTERLGLSQSLVGQAVLWFFDKALGVLQILGPDCEIEDPGFELDRTTTEAETCCPGCDGVRGKRKQVVESGSASFALECAQGPEIPHKLAEAILRYIELNPYNTSIKGELAVKGGIDFSLSADDTSDECTGEACHNRQVSLRGAAEGTGRAEVIVSGYIVAKIELSLMVDIKAPVASSCAGLCVRACLPGATLRLTVQFLTGTDTEPTPPYSERILCSRDLGTYCIDGAEGGGEPLCQATKDAQAECLGFTPEVGGSADTTDELREQVPRCETDPDCNDVCSSAGDCIDDGRECTRTECVGGRCAHVVEEGFCSTTFDGCVAAGTPHPDSPCLVCSPDEDAEGWSPRLEGESCGGGCLTCDSAGLCAKPDHAACGMCEKCGPFGDCVSQAEGEDVKDECLASSQAGGDPCATGACNGASGCGMRQGGCLDCGVCDAFLGCVPADDGDQRCGACYYCDPSARCNDVPWGQDLKGDCPAASPECPDGFCDGAGRCADYNFTGVPCGDDGTCSSEGACVPN
ncbi:MAG: hypothetical protein IT385_16600 [Deltaproteobacteria bacterium]|nr:hypothetical protein [Deltaproteobacteria bacterium]